MDDARFDDLARALAGPATRRGFIGAIAALAAGSLTGRAGAACPPEQIFRRGFGCVCKTDGRPPIDGLCPCPNGQVHCNGSCTDLSRHTGHCGACGAACPKPEAGTCEGAAVCRNGSCAVRPANAGAVCRPAAGPCDVAEVCDGAALECPPDAFLPSGTVCRPAAGACDVEKVCTGVGPACPPDRFLGPDTVCRPAAGPCDLEERCPGTGPDCPPDVLKGPNVVCQAKDACHDDAYCTGESVSCPTHVTFPNDAPCDGAAGFCCDGSCRPCCNNNHAQCDDDNPCTIDTCDGTTCRYSPTCDDGNVCTHNNCDPTNGICTYPNKADRTSCNATGGVCCDGVCTPECCDISDCDHLNSGCVQVMCLNGQCTFLPLEEVEGQVCGENRTCRQVGSVIRCVECEAAAECPTPSNACKRAVCDSTYTCVEEVRQGEACGEAGICTSTADCVCNSEAWCDGGHLAGHSCGSDCICARTVENMRLCVSSSDLQASTTECGSSRDHCAFGGPGFEDLGFCFYHPCRGRHYCAKPCGQG